MVKILVGLEGDEHSLYTLMTDKSWKLSHVEK